MIIEHSTLKQVCKDVMICWHEVFLQFWQEFVDLPLRKIISAYVWIISPKCGLQKFIRNIHCVCGVAYLAKE